MYKSWRTGEFFNSNNVNYLDFVVINKNLQKEKQIKNQRRPIIITEKTSCSNSCSTTTSSSGHSSSKSSSSSGANFKYSNLPFNYENVINKYKK